MLTGLATLVLGCASSPGPKGEVKYILSLGDTEYILKLPAPSPDSVREKAEIRVLGGDYSGRMQIQMPDTSYTHMPNAKPDN
jgi:hypothetical protein